MSDAKPTDRSHRQRPARPGRGVLPEPEDGAVEQPPKVFIDVASTGEGKCPYCGTVYRLKAGEKVHAH